VDKWWLKADIWVSILENYSTIIILTFHSYLQGKKYFFSMKVSGLELQKRIPTPCQDSNPDHPARSPVLYRRTILAPTLETYNHCHFFIVLMKYFEWARGWEFFS
jgi:hypothetical protein